MVKNEKSPNYNVGVGVGVFVCRDGKILMMKRSGAHGSGSWCPPGGKMDHGESPERAAIREVKEETSLHINTPIYLGFTNDLFDEGLHYITLWYATGESSGKARITEPKKCTDQQWSSLEELPKPLFLSTQNALKDKAIRATLLPIIKASTT